MRLGKKLQQGNISMSNHKVVIKTHNSKVNMKEILSTIRINKNHINSGNQTSGMSTTNIMRM